jgi:hypothetical protein
VGHLVHELLLGFVVDQTERPASCLQESEGLKMQQNSISSQLLNCRPADRNSLLLKLYGIIADHRSEAVNPLFFISRVSMFVAVISCPKRSSHAGNPAIGPFDCDTEMV